MKKRRKTRLRRHTSVEHLSDQRTIDFIADRLAGAQEDLADLVADMRTLDHYGEIEDISWCLRIIQRVKRKYEKHEAGREWDD